jgi:outer membrane receptor protein involved in Fe transport
VKRHHLMAGCAASFVLGWSARASAEEAESAIEIRAEAAETEPAPPVDEGVAATAAVEPLDVVVVAKRKGEDPFLADRSVSVVGPKALSEMQPRTTPESLWDTPGLFVQQTNHGAGAPIIRGLVGPQILLVVDGVRLNNSVYRAGPLQYLNLVDPLSLSRVEVLRGPGSVLYGSDAMGGVIQLMPHGPRDARRMVDPEVHGASQVRYASAGKTIGAHARAEVGYRGFGVLAAGTVQSMDDLRGGGDVGGQPYSGYSDYSLLGGAAYRFDGGPLAGAWTKAGYLYSRLDGAGRTDKLYSNNRLQIYDNEMHLVYDRWHFEVDEISTAVEITPSFQHFFERKDTVSMADDLRGRLDAERDEVEVNTFGLDAGLETTLVDDRLALQYGGLFYRDWIDAQRLERAASGAPWILRPDQNYPSGSTYNQFGGFVMLDTVPYASPAGSRIGVRAGYRLHGMAGDAPAQAGFPEADFSHLGHVVMAAAQYQHRDVAVVALSFAQGYRAPNLQEAVMLGDAGQFFHVPNDELGPERSDTVELLGRLKAWRLTWSWAGYVSLLEDLLKREPTTYQGQSEIDGTEVAHHVNAQSGMLLGMEAGLGVDLGRGVSARGHGSYAWGREDLPDGSSQPLSRIPPLNGLAALRYERELVPLWRGFLETYARWAFRQNRLSPRDESDDRIPEGGTPGWWTWNVRAGLAGEGHYRLVLAVENLLNAEYRYHGSGLYAPGTNALVSYEASF